MAISGGTYTVNNGLQQTFKSNMDTQNSTVSSVIGNYSSSNKSDGGWFGIGAYDNSINSHDTVGITPEMLTKITSAIDEYVNNLNATLDAMPTAVDYTQAFKGQGITKAVENFVTTVKDVCKSYIYSLQNVEQQIIKSVEMNYNDSDSDLSGQLNTDSTNISDEDNIITE